MKQNIGYIDRVLRVIIGVVLLLLGLSSKSGFLLLGSLFSFYEAFSSWCLFYQLIGKNTCPIPAKERSTIPFFKPFCVGLCILVGAILLNYLAGLMQWQTWYDFLINDAKILSIDNYIFLFIVYPFALGMIAHIAAKIMNRAAMRNLIE